MKLLNILGAVVVVHIAVLILAVAIPGCRTTTGTTPPSALADRPASAMSSSSPVSSAPELSDSDLNPPLATTTSAADFDPNAAAVSSTTASGRYSPTRPTSAVGTALNPVKLPEATPAVTPVTTYTVKGGDNLWTLAKKNGVSVRELASANDLAPNSGLRVGQVLVIPGGVAATAPATKTAAEMANVKTYTIRPGDTLAKIARAQGTTVSKLKAFNNLRSDLVRAGDQLAIPESESSGAANASATMTSVSAPATTAVVAKPKQGSYQHVVAPGESLTVIAQKYGVKIGDIALANNIRNPALIRPGQSLTIPGWQAPPTKPAASAKPASTAIGNRTVTPLDDDEDLDAGLDDDDLDNVPVIDVEEPPITTISTDGDGGPAIFE